MKNRLSLKDVEWGVFTIGEIFEVEKVYGKPIDEYLNGNTPYISTSGTNNGLIDFIKDDKQSLSLGNCISVDPIAGKSFYHNYDFIGRGFSGASINLLRSSYLNKANAIFICRAIENTSKNKASYGNLFNSKRLFKGKIRLPIDNQNQPNWQFMEDYIKQEQKEIAEKVISYYEQKILETAFDLVGLEDIEWKVFEVQDIFEVNPVRGKPISKYNHGNKPYVTTSSQNNGINGFVDSDRDISRKNSISIDPIGGKAFFHEYYFLGRGGAGSAINLLYNDNLDKNNGQFICTSIERASKEKASYGLQLNGSRLKSMKVLLPADKNGNPHWDYMSKFMQKLEAEKLEKALEYIYIYIG